MTPTASPLDFFIVEATEYVETLDALIGTASRAGPDPERFAKAARGLRGSATMARQYGIADVASALERGARALREGRLRWDPAVHGAVVAAVDDLRILLRSARTWGMREEERVQHRLADLDRIIPAAEMRTSRDTPRSTSAGTAFLARQSTELADALERFCESPSDQETLDRALERARALRGVATLRDVPPLPEIVDAIDDVGKHMALAARPVSPTQIAVFDAAASVLRLSATAIASGERPETGGIALHLFGLAVAALAEQESGADRIVPIRELFPAGVVGIIHAASHPPTTAAQRFRLEAVSQAEHLRRVLADARLPGDALSEERIARELSEALDGLTQSADSFGEKSVADFVRAWSERVLAKDSRALTAMDSAAALLADATGTPDVLAESLRRLLPRDQSGATPKRRTPTGRELQSTLTQTLEGFSALENAPLHAARPTPVEEIVPIESLLYRGRAALERARALRAELTGAGELPSPDALQELYDLIELAAAE